MTYDIRNEITREIIASNLTIEEVDAWWAANQNSYFGVQVHNNEIIVATAGA